MTIFCLLPQTLQPLKYSTPSGSTTLHPLVAGPHATLRGHPVDNLIGIGDIASLAVDAVRGVDLETPRAFFFHHFVHGGRAKILAGIAVLHRAALVADVGVGNEQVAGLILFILCARVVNVRELVEGQLAVGCECATLLTGV